MGGGSGVLIGAKIPFETICLFTNDLENSSLRARAGEICGHKRKWLLLVNYTN